jgi:hypothetical protein
MTGFNVAFRIGNHFIVHLVGSRVGRILDFGDSFVSASLGFLDFDSGRQQ